MRKKALRAIIVFFSLMALLTLVSRAADSVTIARVRTQRVGSGALNHEARATGIVEAGDITPVWAMEGLRVDRVVSSPGEAVKEGDVLIEYDAEHVKSIIADEKLALKKLTAQVTSQTSLDMQADMLPRQRELDKAKEVLDEANGTRNKREAAKALALVQEEYDIALRQWEEKLAVDERAQSALNDEIAALSGRIEELEKLLKDGAALKAPFDGVVVSVDISIGKLTGSEAVATLAKAGGQLTTRVSLTSDEAKYVRIGDKASYQLSGRRDWEEGTVVGLTPLANGDYEAAVSVDDPSISIGQTVNVKFSKKTDSYAQCVPLTALYGDSAGDYVYVLTKSKSVLGDVTSAERVSITVLDRDMARAAISGSLVSEDKIVVHSDKPISHGARVREEA